MAILIIIIVCFIIVKLALDNARVKRELKEDYENKEQMEKADITQAPYNIGEYYNDGKNQGYVFSIENAGYHGKIISLSEWKGQWSKTKQSYGSTLQTPVLASSNKSGKINKQTIQKLVTLDNYPILWDIEHSYAYTKQDWYLPAIDELVELSKCRSLINSNIESKRYTYKLGEKIRDGEYLSSTELEDNILSYHFNSGTIWKENKDAEINYRLVYEF